MGRYGRLCWQRIRINVFLPTTNRIQLSQIRVSEWSGNLAGQSKAVTGNFKDDFALFTNDDSVSGNIQSIKDGRMKIATSFGQHPIRLEKVNVIYMAKKGRWPN